MAAKQAVDQVRSIVQVRALAVVSFSDSAQKSQGRETQPGLFTDPRPSRRQLKKRQEAAGRLASPRKRSDWLRGLLPRHQEFPRTYSLVSRRINFGFLISCYLNSNGQLAWKAQLLCIYSHFLYSFLSFTKLLQFVFLFKSKSPTNPPAHPSLDEQFLSATLAMPSMLPISQLRATLSPCC